MIRMGIFNVLNGIVDGIINVLNGILNGSTGIST